MSTCSWAFVNMVKTFEKYKALQLHMKNQLKYALKKYKTIFLAGFMEHAMDKILIIEPK